MNMLDRFETAFLAKSETPYTNFHYENKHYIRLTDHIVYAHLHMNLYEH